MTHYQMLKSPLRNINGRVELFEGSTLLQTFTKTDALQSFTVSRMGDKKFFGFGITQKVEVKLVDRDRLINIQKGQVLKISFEVDGNYNYPTPPFYVSEITRDENTNGITVKAEDFILNKVSQYTINDLGLPEDKRCSIAQLEAEYITNLLGINCGNQYPIYFNDSELEYVYENGINVEGTEPLRDLLDDMAEALSCIYYMNPSNELMFKPLIPPYIDADYNIMLYEASRNDYFTLSTKDFKRLAEVVSATELGDNVSYRNDRVEGEAQYVWDNAFWTMREDIDEVIRKAWMFAGNEGIHEFNLDWRGNYLIQPGDYFLIDEDNLYIETYLINDEYTYNGGLHAKTSWEFAANNSETANNPSTLGDNLKKTFAKVDKTKHEVDIVAGEVSGLKLTTDGITATVKQTDAQIADIMAEVSAKVSAEDVSFIISQTAKQGTEKVITTTGYTFNEEGLKVSKSDSEITTTISEDGMEVYRKNEPVLTANNQGVKAEDLHATTFLIIGNNSRLEDYGSGRTGCFWIGGF